jgi:2-C-methyl-D-erythritol 2,4-cyclodiphosphate synthase
MSSLRTGLGFDTHRLVAGRRFLLGGVDIQAAVGAQAHSDGDVLIHALCDALYGAVGRGDIGEHFPDSDPRWKDRDSAHFLEHACRVVRDAGYRLVNVDATVFLEKVRLSPHKQTIARNLARLMAPFWDLPEGWVNVKAKTMEGCDAIGRGEAVGAQVAVLVARLGD